MVLPFGDQLSESGTPPVEANLWALVPLLCMLLMSLLGVE